MELFDAAFFDFDFPELVAGLALGDVLKRAELLALHEGAAAGSLPEFRLFAIRIAFQLLEVRALDALAHLLLQAATLWTGVDSDAFLTGAAFAALRGRVLKRDALLLSASALVGRLLQFLTGFAFNWLEFAVIWLHVLTFKSFTTAILHLYQFLAFFAFRLDDFGTDGPDASQMRAFASVVRVEFGLLLVLLALDFAI